MKKYKVLATFEALFEMDLDGEFESEDDAYEAALNALQKLTRQKVLNLLDEDYELEDIEVEERSDNSN